MDDKLREQIVDGLVRQHSRSDIVEGVCNATGLDWPRAEKLVQQVEREQAHRIGGGQLLLIAAISAMMAATGMFMLAFSIVTITHLIGTNVASSVAMLATRYRFPVVIGFLGLQVMVGSGIGLYQSLLRYFET